MAFSEIVKAWMFLAEDDRLRPLPSDAVVEVCSLFLKSFLSKPLGFRKLISESEENENDQDFENEEFDDLVSFDVHFNTISKLLRNTVWKGNYTCLEGLNGFIRDRLEALKCLGNMSYS